MIPKEEQGCWNCALIKVVIKSGKPCELRPKTNIPVHCPNWKEIGLEGNKI